MGVRRSAPTEAPGEVLDRILDKGIVASASLRLGDEPIELVGRKRRIVVEPAAAGETEQSRPRRAA